MPTYLNPPALGDNSAAGLSLGVASDVFTFASGLALDPETGRRRADADTVAAETKICLQNIEAILGEAGLTLRDIVKTTCYVSDEAHRFDFIGAYREVFEPGPYPARNTYSLGLAADLRVLIEVIAVHPDAD